MTEYVLIRDGSDLKKYEKSIEAASVVAVDTETTGLDPHRDTIRLIQLAVPRMPVLIVDCQRVLPEGLSTINRMLATKAVKIFQNAKFDLKFLQQSGVHVSLPLFDTMLAAQLLRQAGGPERVGLDSLVKHYLQMDISKEEQRSDWSRELSHKQLQYASLDAAVLIPLREAMVPQLINNGLTEVARLEFACVRALAQTEYNGIHLDLSCWMDLHHRVAQDKKKSLDRIYSIVGRPAEQQTLFGDDVPVGLNPDSNQQVIEWLKEQGIMVENTSRHTLTAYLDHPLVSAVLQYRQAAKSMSSFLATYAGMIHPVTRRLHPQYSQIGAWSGRMSCSKPNIQQIPREYSFRACFTAPAGRKLIMADYSQIELRVAAEISEDQRMMDAYRRGEDLHRLTASLITGIAPDQISPSQRQAAKAVNFGLIYGMGAKGLMDYARDTYGTDMTEEEAALFRNRFFEAYAGIARWHQSLRLSAPGQAQTLSGRQYQFAERAGLSVHTNIPVQGGAADILKQALGNLVDELISVDARIVAVVHDEIILEAAEDQAETVSSILKRVMEDAGAHYLKRVPVCADVKIGSHWGEK